MSGNEDKKSLNILYEKIVTLAQKSKRNKNSKHVSIKTFCNKEKKNEGIDENVSPKLEGVTKRRQRKSPSVKKIAETKSNQISTSPKITEWLRKPSKSKQELTVNTKYKQLCETEEATTIKTKKKLNLNVSASYIKYGIEIPSFENILKEQKKLKADIESINSMFEDSISVPKIEDPDLSIPEEYSKNNYLNCKHLDKVALKEIFYKHFDYISNILSEKKYELGKSVINDHFFDEIPHNMSLIVFTREQKLVLAKLLRKKFAGTNFINMQYSFKVLLPELCFKIFMDEYSMSVQEAEAYLKQVPID